MSGQNSSPIGSGRRVLASASRCARCARRDSPGHYCERYFPLFPARLRARGPAWRVGLSVGFFPSAPREKSWALRVSWKGEQLSLCWAPQLFQVYNHSAAARGWESGEEDAE